MTLIMNLPGQLYKLQQLDSELQRLRQYIDEIDRQLNENKALTKVEANLVSIKQQLTDIRKNQKDAEWKLEDMSTINYTPE